MSFFILHTRNVDFTNEILNNKTRSIHEKSFINPDFSFDTFRMQTK
jgi:hypothetical protein